MNEAQIRKSWLVVIESAVERANTNSLNDVQLVDLLTKHYAELTKERYADAADRFRWFMSTLGSVRWRDRRLLLSTGRQLGIIDPMAAIGLEEIADYRMPSALAKQ